jgi:hypothetical protein
MIAYKFLSRGRIAPFTGFQWPAAGCWVERDHWAEGSGVHACRLSDLPYWVGDELWRIELDGPILERETQIEAARGRLIESVSGWDLCRFASACALRTRDLALQAVRGPDVADVAKALLNASDMSRLLSAARSASPLPGLAGEMVAYVADAAVRALEGNAGSSSHTAAVAAVALHGHRAAFAEERRWQSRWLAAELALER